MKFYFRLLLIYFSILYSLSIQASPDKCPFINKSTIIGTWEAVFTEDTVRVFRLEFFGDGHGSLTQAMGYGKSTVSKLEHIFISNEKIELFFKNGNTGFNYKENGKLLTTKGEDLLSGVGYACNFRSGALDLVFQMEPNLPSHKKWKLRFIKFPENKLLTQTLSEMSDVAKAAAKQTK